MNDSAVSIIAAINERLAKIPAENCNKTNQNSKRMQKIISRLASEYPEAAKKVPAHK